VFHGGVGSSASLPCTPFAGKIGRQVFHFVITCQLCRSASFRWRWGARPATELPGVCAGTPFLFAPAVELNHNARIPFSNSYMTKWANVTTSSAIAIGICIHCRYQAADTVVTTNTTA
jgi:hypothetical protein